MDLLFDLKILYSDDILACAARISQLTVQPTHLPISQPNSSSQAKTAAWMVHQLINDSTTLIEKYHSSLLSHIFCLLFHHPKVTKRLSATMMFFCEEFAMK
jgi:hypothetical protein